MDSEEDEVNKFVGMCYVKKDCTDKSKTRLVLQQPIKMSLS